MLKIYDSLSQKKQVFKPIEPGKIGMYVCGITVYDYCHIGHARTSIAFDTMVSYFRFLGYQVKFVRNVTDIDDKIITRAKENNETVEQLSSRFEKIMLEDFDSLGIARPDIEPKATESIKEIIELVQTLVEKGFAYQGSDGDVYYNVPNYDDYGKLSKQNLEALNLGERIEVASDKKSPMDFVLWKLAKAGEPSWPSPWGEGRPGWHIECSAMSKKCLGKNFDIHGGGSDLSFPHHENEIAQSEAANGCDYANLWIHTGMVQVDKQKMSKSLNNFFTIREVLKSYRPETLRYFLVSSHYRSQISYSKDNLDAADASLQRLYFSLQDLDLSACKDEFDENSIYVKNFKVAMDDDFNTAEAVSVLFELAKEINRLKTSDPKEAKSLATILIKLGGLLGLLKSSPEAFLKSSVDVNDVDIERIEALIVERNQAREDKNWARADEIRDELDSMNILLQDKDGKTHWRRS